MTEKLAGNNGNVGLEMSVGNVGRKCWLEMLVGNVRRKCRWEMLVGNVGQKYWIKEIDMLHKFFSS